MIPLHPFPRPFTQQTPVSAEAIRVQAALGLDRAGIAEALGVTYSNLCKQIAAKFTLCEAEKRGQAEYVASLLNKRKVA